MAPASSFATRGGSQMDQDNEEECTEELRRRLKDVEDDYANLDFYANEIREKRDRLKARVEELEQHHHRQTGNEKGSETQISKLESRVKELEQDISTKEKSAVDSRKRIKTLEGRVEELEYEITTKEPLYKIGVSIRARFLDNAKPIALAPKNRKAKVNQSLKKAGDGAAHNAMGATDRLLFQKGVLPASDQSRLLPIFTGLYSCAPEAHADLPHAMQQTIDCEGTIRTLLVLNNALRPLAERETAMIDIEFIRKKHELLGREAFESSEEVARRLARLREMTEQIVGMDHKRTVENMPRRSSGEV